MKVVIKLEMLLNYTLNNVLSIDKRLNKDFTFS